MIKNTARLFWISIGCVVLLQGCSRQSYDVVIKGGTIVDGSGAPGYRSDIGIKEGKIAAVTMLKKFRALEEIDAGGKFVVPGFIDMHTHCENISSDKLKTALNYLTQGVTTVVTGNCGSGTHRVAKYFRKMKAQGIGLNVVHLVGHGTVRGVVLKGDDREPDAEELARMKSLVRRALEEGAAGLSTGLFYAPGSYARTDEVIALCGVVRELGGFYATHIRDESDYSIGLEAAIAEAVEIGERSAVPVQISHIKALGKPVWGKAEAVCRIIDDARERGVKIYADQYPYCASSTSLAAAVVPRWVQAGGKMCERLRDQRLLPRIRKEMAENIERRGGAETLVISAFPRNADWEGRSLEEISTTLGKSETDAAVELIFMGDPGVVSFNQTEADVAYFLRQPWVMTGSDGQVLVFGEGKPHPRNYGTFPRKIRNYVFLKKVISMEQAVRSSSGLPAEMLGLEDRGLLKESYAADIVVFDPERIGDKATFRDPHQYSEGIDYVLIDGKLVISDGEFTGVLAGKPLAPRGRRR
ncbi:MAG: D-aminoacylase [Candidatus Aminicenantes bacterium]|nr:D-aminoacylase [Candidatus Aminicenantes bacterium]